nr:hypothetical protein [Tanacetum cinerariifolium]
MTRSSTNKLFTPYKEPKQEFRSSRRHFKTPSLDELRSHDFNLLSDQEYSEEEVAETIAETMEQYMSKTRADYGSGVARPNIENKDNFELKGQFLKELCNNTFSSSDHEDANEHIEKVLEIVDLFHILNITMDQVVLKAFPMSLTGAVSRWLRSKPTENMDAYCDKGMGDVIVGEQFLREVRIKSRRFEGTITRYKDDKSGMDCEASEYASENYGPYDPFFSSQ